eukprot:m.978641 g.978641  ORF g.978641 m.978641 type:complete len:1272 (+) comp23961_c0_seq4:258-4073(+)
MPEETVRVLVRCRPFNKRETDMNCGNVIKMDGSSGLCKITKPGSESNPPKSFTFDAVYDMTSNSQTIYEEMAFPVVEGCLQGFNGTVFAYGQTGCGKSFTMEGIPDPPIHRGITPRSFEHIFDEVSVRENTKFLIRASYLEIYNEQVRDLLSNNVTNRLDLREDPDRGVYVQGLTLHDAMDSRSMIKLMARGTENRSVGATAMNADSSRSHSIFTVWIEMCETRPDGTDAIKAGKLNLVDLAGSERQSKTQAEGARLKEATKINLSLSALGNVISALVDGKAKHIPYRDSKLTRLLQDSLGGNTKTLMIAAISPADNNYDETLSTLRYANRAKNIKNVAKINEDPKDALLREYQEEIKKLKAMLAGQLGVDESNIGPLSPPDGADPGKRRRRDSTATSEDSNALLEAQKQRLQQEHDAKIADIEAKLKKDYDDKLAELERMAEDETIDASVVEEAFAKATQEYETGRTQALEAANAAPASDATTTGADATVAIAPSQPVAVVGPDGAPVIALRAPDGTYVKAVLGADQQLHPVLDDAGLTIVLTGPNGDAAVPLDANAMAVDAADGDANSAAVDAEDESAAPPPVIVRFVPATVIGPDGTPVAALVDPEGRAVRARVNADGQLEPVVDDVTGDFVFVESADGPGHAPKAHTADEPVPVLDGNGNVTIAVMDSSGRPVHAEIGDDGELQPQMDSAGKTRPVLGPDGSRAHELRQLEPVEEPGVGYVVPALTAVIGPGGTPIPAIVLSDGTPVEVTVSATGHVQAVRTDDGAYKVIRNASTGLPAQEVQRTSALQVVSGGADGEAMVAVRAADGELTAAEMGSDGLVAAAVDASGWPKALDAAAAKVVPVQTMDTMANVPRAVAQSTQPSRPNAVVVVADSDGQAVPAIVAANGERLRAKLKNGKLVAMRDKAGKFVPMPAITETSLDILQPNNEMLAEEPEECLGDVQVDTQAQRAALSPTSALNEEVEKQVQERLRELQKHLVGNTRDAVQQETSSDQEKKKKLREELRRKKSRAERKRLERLRLATASDDEHLFEAILDKQSGKVEEHRQKFQKAKELLAAARDENRDIQREFEREREDFLDTIREQDKQIKFFEAFLNKIQPTIRRDCNYYNVDKIRTVAEWNEETESWIMPTLNVTKSGGSLEHVSPSTGRRAGPGGGLDAAADERLRARLGGAHTAADEYLQQPKRSRAAVLGSMERTATEIAAQQELRLARFSNAGPQHSARGRELMEEAERLRTGGGASPPSSAVGSPKLLTRRGKGYSANDWLR